MEQEDGAPIACTLMGTDYKARMRWIAELNRQGLTGHARTGLTLTLHYRPECRAQVTELVAREQSCCAFLKFAVTEGATDIRVTIAAPERARNVADAVFEQFVSPTRVMPMASGSQPCCEPATGSTAS
ncbi:MAG: hypothetical protein ABL986_19755 [Vicinamibacterales bacterium]